MKIKTLIQRLWRHVGCLLPASAALGVTLIMGVALTELTTCQASAQATGVNVFGGQWHLGPDLDGTDNGVAIQWRGDGAADWLVAQIEKRAEALDEAGVPSDEKKIVINRVAGGSNPETDGGPEDQGSHVTGAFWTAIPEYKRGQLLDGDFADRMNALHEQYPGIRIGLFVGSSIRRPGDPRDLLIGWQPEDGPYPGTLANFDPDKPDELALWHREWDPWAELGMNWVILDASAGKHNRDWLVRLNQYMRQYDVVVDGEAIPLDSGYHRAHAGWWGLYRVARRQHDLHGPNMIEDGTPLDQHWLRPWERLILRIDSIDVERAIAAGWVPEGTTIEDEIRYFRKRGWIVQTSAEHASIAMSAMQDVNGIAIEDPETGEQVEVLLPPDIDIDDQERIGELVLWIWKQGVDTGRSRALDDAAEPPAPDPDPCAGLVNVNTADYGELQTITGIGPALAARIVQSREEVGPFTSPTELQQRVSGIGPATIEIIAPQVCFLHE